MATALTLITAALQDLGVLDATQTPDAATAEIGLARLNSIIQAASNEGLTAYTTTRTTWTITSGDGEYTVGNGGDINIRRPVGPSAISGVGFQDTSTDPVMEYDLGPLLTEDQYRLIALKDQESTYPTSAYYNPVFSPGILKLWPIPTSSTLEGVIYVPTRLVEYAATTDTFLLPQGYELFLRTRLVMALAKPFRVAVTAEMRQDALAAEMNLARTNFRPSDLSFATGALSGYGRYDINSDSYH